MRFLDPRLVRMLSPACPPIPILSAVMGFVLALLDRGVPVAEVLAVLLVVASVTVVLATSSGRGALGGHARRGGRDQAIT